MVGHARVNTEVEVESEAMLGMTTMVSGPLTISALYGPSADPD
jgi:hypothetical protein